MSELRELYQQVILDHTKRPRNFRTIPDTANVAEGFNRLCGDRITLYIKVENDRVADIAFQGAGCAISTAAASMMTEALKGRPLAEVEPLFKRFHAMVTSPPDQEVDDADLGKLAVFAGVREFPVRVKCATLAWHTLKAALDHKSGQVTTE